MGSENLIRDSLEILKMLPHRFPFLLVDKVTQFEPGRTVEAVKNVTFNEPFFQGHFPDYPVMPGVLIVESLAQTGGILVIKSTPDLPENKIFLFSGIEKFKFRKAVYPGDQLILRASFLKQKMNLWKMRAEAMVNSDLVAHGILTAAMVDRES